MDVTRRNLLKGAAALLPLGLIMRGKKSASDVVLTATPDEVAEIQESRADDGGRKQAELDDYVRGMHRIDGGAAWGEGMTVTIRNGPETIALQVESYDLTYTTPRENLVFDRGTFTQHMMHPNPRVEFIIRGTARHP